ncbi:hypothetical protein V2W45_1330293 [Cenococcum geophilum]
MTYNTTRFLLAYLYIDLLLDKDTIKAVKLTLKRFPRGSKDSKALKQPTTTELYYALAVELGKKELDLDNIPNIKDIVSICAGLAIIDKESDIIRLVHYTT